MSDLYVYLMRSRNKDNKDIEEFKERSKVILEYKENEEKVREKFWNFAEQGLTGEKTRLYRSVNSRNEDKIIDNLLIRLIKDKPSMTKLNSVLASVAQSKETRDENKWMFDFDCNDEEVLIKFIVYLNSKGINSETHKTPNGYAIVVEHGFDTRELFEIFKDYDIALKRDDLLFLEMYTKEKEYE